MYVFTCPKCKSNRLEEILVNVVQSSFVVLSNRREDNDAIDYGATTTEDGVVDRYQCLECGRIVPNATTPEKLYRDSSIQWEENP